MRKNKLVALALVAAMAITASACTGTSSSSSASSSQSSQAEASSSESSKDLEEETTTEAPAPVEVEGDLDFEDGNYAFAKVISGADKSELSVVDYNGSKALYAKNTEGEKMSVGFDVNAILGENVTKLAKIQVNIGIESSDSEFYSASGFIYSYAGEVAKEVKGDAWSVYLETANPKTVTFDLSGVTFVDGANNYIAITKETDNAPAAQNMYFDNIVFYDADDNVLAADSTAEAGAIGESAGADRMNLFGIEKAITIDDFAGVKDGGWSQGAQITLTEDQLAALVPGSVIEISYKSENGELWIVLPGAPQWQRIGDGDYAGNKGANGYAYVNGAGNIAQITYEQIAAVLGEDTTAWGNVLQCESSGAWEVNSVKIGTKVDNYVVTGATSLGASTKDGGWSQGAQITLTEDQIALLVPGSAFEISYKSVTGEMWMVFPGATKGWTRVGQANYAGDNYANGSAQCDGSTAVLTYEQIAAVLGDSVADWGNVIQCEASSAWEVTDIKIGTATKVVQANSFVDVPDFAGVKDGGWSQGAQITLTEDQLAALVPGSVIEISYKSENGELWIVLPGAPQWQRIGDGDYAGNKGANGYAYVNGAGNIAQITYEQIAAVLGEDTTAWGNVLQCEASGAWEVNSLKIGIAK